jgi:hypothetical protein
MKDAKARLVFGGMRLGDVSTRVRQLLLEKKAKKQYAEANACLTQLDSIGKQRDKLVHRFVDIGESELRVTNFLTAKSLASIEEDAFKKSDLMEMELDCLAIYMRLSAVRSPAYRKTNRASLPRAWRYKAPNPKSQATQSRKHLGG